MLENLRRKSLSYSYINLINKIHIEKGHAIYLNACSIAEHKQRLSKKKTEKTFASTFDGVSKKFRNISNTLSGVVFNMIYCPAGTFTMGLEDQEDNQPRPETIEKAFLLGETEVTEGLYYNEKNKNFPVENVTWYDAILFCNELSKLQGLDECYILTDISTKDKYGDDEGRIMSAKVTCDFNKNGYRLPTEKEWEYAAKAGTNNRWAGTDDPEDLWLYAQIGKNDEDDADASSCAVKEKAPNEWGFYDMSGNVWEWCWDKYNPDTQKPSASRVMRGGCYLSKNIEIAYRVSENPYEYNEYTGFRICRTLI